MLRSWPTNYKLYTSYPAFHLHYCAKHTALFPSTIVPKSAGAVQDQIVNGSLSRSGAPRGANQLIDGFLLFHIHDFTPHSRTSSITGNKPGDRKLHFPQLAPPVRSHSIKDIQYLARGGWSAEKLVMELPVHRCTYQVELDGEPQTDICIVFTKREAVSLSQRDSSSSSCRDPIVDAYRGCRKQDQRCFRKVPFHNNHSKIECP